MFFPGLSSLRKTEYQYLPWFKGSKLNMMTPQDIPHSGADPCIKYAKDEVPPGTGTLFISLATKWCQRITHNPEHTGTCHSSSFCCHPVLPWDRSLCWPISTSFPLSSERPRPSNVPTVPLYHRLAGCPPVTTGSFLLC